MPLLSRNPIATAVCPLAPFLAPRLLRTPTRLSTLYVACNRLSLQQATFATKTKAKSKAKSKRSKPERPVYVLSEKQKAKKEYVDQQVALMDKFQHACLAREIPKLMSLYPFVLESPLLKPQHTHRIWQALHAYTRNNRGSRDELAAFSHLLPFMNRVMDDIRQGKLPPHTMAHVHILSILKEREQYEEGYQFWTWLAEQDNTFVDQAVYGAAIELLTYRGQHSLQELEDIYQDALKRFPGTFAEYHLSPEAVVPDRSRAITIPGIPMGLLQGILTARILNGDWKKAYLALDTALRLYPASVPHRFFELFMTERSVSEAYTIFLLACRSGVLFKPNHLTKLLSNLRDTAHQRILSQSERLLIIRAMANAIYAYMESGGALDGPHVGTFFDAIKTLLGPMHAHEPSETDKAAKSSLVLEAVQAMATTLTQAGFRNRIFTIGIADEFGSDEMLRSSLEVLERSDPSSLSDVTRRLVLQAVGRLGDQDLVAKYWSRIVDSAKEKSNTIHVNDWLAFAKSCHRAKIPQYFRSQLSSLAHAIEFHTEERCLALLETPERRPRSKAYTYMSVAEMKQGLEEIESIMSNVAAVLMLGKPLDLARTPFCMFLDPNHQLMAPESSLRKIYDELTTDPRQPELPKDPQAKPEDVHRSPTGIPFDELRFQNWVAINELLLTAEATKQELQARVDEAMASGKPMQRVPSPILFRYSQRPASPADAREHSETDAGDDAARLADLKARIVRLRTPVAV